jgi:PAS domain S-box-containing protein
MEQGLHLCAFTDLLSLLPGLHWWESQDDHTYSFAPACARLTGLIKKDEPLRPDTWQLLLHPHDRQRRLTARQQLSIQEETTIEYRLQTSTGYQWIQEHIRLVQTEDAGPVYLSTAITCQEPLHRAILNNISLFVVLTDPKGNIQEFNETSEPFLRQQHEAAWNQPLWNSPCFQQHPHAVKQIKEALQKASAGEVVRLHEWTLSYNELQFTGNFTVKPIYNHANTLEYLLVEGSDLSHQTRTDQQWRTLAENIPDVIIRYDRQFRYLFVNPAIETFTGQKPQFFLGKRAAEIKFSTPGWEGFEACLQKVLQTRQMQTYTGQVQGVPGQDTRNIYSLLVPEPDETGEVASILVITRDITELAKQEKALEQINAKLRAIIEGTPDLVFAFDTQKRLLAFNAAFSEEMKQLFGVQPILHMSMEEMLLHHPAELKNAQDLWNRALQGEEFTILQEFGDSSRERNYYEITFSSILNAEGTLIGASSRTRNVSQERSFQKELKDAREFLVLAENLPQIIFTARPDGQIDYLNHAFYDYTEQPFGPAEFADWKKALHPDDYKETALQWLEAIHNIIPGLQLEVRLRNRYGLYRWHIARAVPIFNDMQVPIKWVGVISDVHEAKISSERERLAADEFKAISESLPHIVWTTRPNGRATYFNSKWYEYTGAEVSSQQEWDWYDYVHPEDRVRTQKAWKKAVSTASHYQVEYRLRHQSGRYRWFLARGVPVTDPSGQVSKWFGTCTDIHENKLQRKRLQTQNERLNQINQYLDNFVHAAAHDLRSPVANMKGLLQLLRAYDHEGTGNKVVQSMETSLYRLDNTLQAMIHSIELQSLKQSPAKLLQLEEVFQQVRLDFSDRLHGIPYTIQTDFEECPSVVFIPFYLESLFRNLLSNAIKYRKEDQLLSIKVSCRKYRTYKLLEFSDNGIGLDVEKYKDKLFRPFQRFTQQASGKGIGLHLINNIVTKTGGKMEVKSQLGQGATFRMYLKDIEI